MGLLVFAAALDDDDDAEERSSIGMSQKRCQHRVAVLCF
jgi:hypothetical protein